MTPSFEASATLIVGQGAQPRSYEPEQLSRTSQSIARIAESEEVIQDAVQKVGLDRLVDQSSDHGSTYPGNLSLLRKIAGRVNFEAFKPWFNNFEFASQAAPTSLERAIPAISQALKVKPELTSDIIHISFRNRNPIVAAAFANAVANSVIDRQLNLSTASGAARFYDRQAEVFANEIKRASDALERFTAKNGVYSIDDQKKLLLKRASELESALFTTREQIAETASQAEALSTQLHLLKPVTQSQFVSSVVDAMVPSRNSCGGVAAS